MILTLSTNLINLINMIGVLLGSKWETTPTKLNIRPSSINVHQEVNPMNSVTEICDVVGYV